MKAVVPLANPERRLYTVYFPSGSILALEGVFAGVVINGEFSPCVNRVKSKDDAVVLDPRCVVTRAEGIVYEPRRNGKVRPAWVQEWLEEHPEWPPIDLRTVQK